MSGHYPDRIRTLPAYDGRFDAYKLEARGADVLFASCAAGIEIPLHDHSTDNSGVITRGELALFFDGRETRHGVGDWYHVAAGVEHAVRFEQDTDAIEFWFPPGGNA